MPLTTGVDIVEMSNSTKATKKRMVNGVAGRNIVKALSNHSGDQVELKGDAFEVQWCLFA